MLKSQTIIYSKHDIVFSRANFTFEVHMKKNEIK